MNNSQILCNHVGRVKKTVEEGSKFYLLLLFFLVVLRFSGVLSSSFITILSLALKKRVATFDKFCKRLSKYVPRMY